MKTLKAIYITIFCFIAYYLVFSFITWNFNIADWNWFARIVYVLLSITSIGRFI